MMVYMAEKVLHCSLDKSLKVHLRGHDPVVVWTELMSRTMGVSQALPFSRKARTFSLPAW